MAIPAPLAYPPTALRNVAAGLVVGNPIGSSGARGKALTGAELKAIVEASGISYLPLSGGTLTGNLVAPAGGSGTPSIRIGTQQTGLASFANTELTLIVQGTNIGRFSQLQGQMLVGPLILGGSYNLYLHNGGAGIFEQRNGLNAQCQIIAKTYTSGTSLEGLMLDAGKQISGKLGIYSYRGSSGGSNNPIQIGMLASNGSTFTGLTVGTDGTTQIVLPTADPHVVGVPWNNSGTITISAG